MERGYVQRECDGRPFSHPVLTWKLLAFNNSHFEICNPLPELHCPWEIASFFKNYLGKYYLDGFISYCHQGRLCVFFSVRNKSGNLSFQRHGRSLQGARGTWCFQKPFNNAASCHPPSGGGLSPSFLSPTGSEPIWGHSTAFSHAHTDTHTCTHTHTQTNQLQSNRRWQNVATVSPDL